MCNFKVFEKSTFERVDAAALRHENASADVYGCIHNTTGQTI
jgi:hypothetical protein